MKWRVPAGLWAGRAAFILGGGPSLRGFDVDRLRGRGAVIGVNNAALDLAPWADLLFFADGMDRWYGWNRNRLHLFQGDLIVTRTQVPPPHDPRLRRLIFDPKQALSRDPAVLAGFCGGSSAINLAHLLGARVIVLLGFDMRSNGNWHDLHRLPSLPDQHRAKFIPALERMAPELDRDGCLVLNATPGSALRCFPEADIEELLAMDDLAAAEAEKYRRIWERPEYRRISPGMIECERAWTCAGMAPGATLTDFGAGTGRATAWFRDRGLDVLAVDHVDSALETSVPMIVECLWSMSDAVPVSDYGFCCDVMEHIPPEKVAAVLAGIRARVRVGCWFRIATRIDQMGRLIGQPLHLTVRGGGWWRAQVEAHFGTVDVIHKDDSDVIMWARP
jgi:hypothetical protein